MFFNSNNNSNNNKIFEPVTIEEILDSFHARINDILKLDICNYLVRLNKVI